MKQAMIFAAGLGTRLRPLTDHCPKALVQVGGKPMLQHLIEKLKVAGFEHLVVNVHHFADQIVDFLSANDSFGMKIDISDERGMLLETGGGIRQALPMFSSDSPILIHNVDIITDLDLFHFTQSANDMWLHNRGDAVLVVNERKTSRYLLFDDDNILRGWTNVSTGAVKSPISEFNPAVCHPKAFAGIHFISPSLFSDFKPWSGAFSIIDFYLSLAASRSIVAYDAPQGMRWVDAGKPEALETAAAIVKGK